MDPSKCTCPRLTNESNPFVFCKKRFIALSKSPSFLKGEVGSSKTTIS